MHGERNKVCQDIHCLVLTHSAEADTEKLISDSCNINMLVVEKTFKKVHYGEMCWYSLHESEGHTRTV